MRFGGALVALILALGLAGAVAALNGREVSPQFVSAQKDLAPVSAQALERLILTTSDPRPGYALPPAPARARAARCVAAGGSALGNPWSCVVRYPRPPAVRYGVRVHADGSISGSGQPVGRPLHGVLTLSGCCVLSSGS
ncbi:MAG TPA: hypothetical protein VNU24_01270 [Solirubrobacteraceae bacterium]|jgi:hypothetical protein|nr:hypothetical protein [Solirubrobacteraceae bacterium]